MSEQERNAALLKKQLFPPLNFPLKLLLLGEGRRAGDSAVGSGRSCSQKEEAEGLWALGLPHVSSPSGYQEPHTILSHLTRRKTSLHNPHY